MFSDIADNSTYSATHQAYLPIVASSIRASTLHYCCNDKEFAWGPVGKRDHLNVGAFQHSEHKCSGEGDGQVNGTTVDGREVGEQGIEGDGLEPQVLLIDAGCEWECYASDSKWTHHSLTLLLMILSSYSHDARWQWW
jgi:Xaa-Pro dipeptidase